MLDWLHDETIPLIVSSCNYLCHNLCMHRKTYEHMNCSIAKALEEVGEWWTLLIVRDCTQGAVRFDEFQKSLGIARNILSARLERLTRLGILERFPLKERQNTFGYQLTQKGEDLYPVLIALFQWGERWLRECDCSPISLVDDASGQPIEQLSVVGADGRKLSYRDIRFTAGPGATERTRTVIADRNRRVLIEPTEAVRG